VRLGRKAPSDKPALKPYWGKLAVRNFRGGAGNVMQGWLSFATPLERVDTLETTDLHVGAPVLYSMNYDELAKPLIEVQLMQVQPGQSRSGQAGSACCHSSGDWRVRSVHSE
jgi:hypothetical protein